MSPKRRRSSLIRVYAAATLARRNSITLMNISALWAAVRRAVNS
jgi:hypothetical protein